MLNLCSCSVFWLCKPRQSVCLINCPPAVTEAVTVDAGIDAHAYASGPVGPAQWPSPWAQTAAGIIETLSLPQLERFNKNCSPRYAWSLHSFWKVVAILYFQKCAQQATRVYILLSVDALHLISSSTVWHITPSLHKPALLSVGLSKNYSKNMLELALRRPSALLSFIPYLLLYFTELCAPYTYTCHFRARPKYWPYWSTGLRQSRLIE